MKTKLSLVVAALLVAAVPFGAMAMQHEQGGNGHGGHGQAGQEMAGGHGEMAGGGHEEMAMLGSRVEDGVKATAHLNDVRAAMAGAGLKETHHFMILFEADDTGKIIETGTVALKVKGPGGLESGPVALPGMDGHFGADIVLSEKGAHEFTVGAKLPDGKIRQFQFNHPVD